jgi:hypothetical protein
MIRLRYFFRSMNILNGLLLPAVAAVVYFVVIPFLNPAVQMAPPPVRATAVLPAEKAAPAWSATPADYALISDQNLFHPERRIPLEQKPEIIKPKPDVFLYGTLITDEGSFAFIEDKRSPHTTPGRGKRQTTLKKGDSLSGYILQEVEANRIVLVKGDEKVIVMLDDKEKRRASGEAKAAPATFGTAQVAMPSLPLSGPSSLPVAPSSASAVGSPMPGIGVVGSRQFSQPVAPASSQPAPSSAPGAGGTDTRPITRRERVEAGKAVRMQQMQQP